MMSLVQLISWLVAAFLGAIAHEVAHWIVWQLTGRQPRFRWWQLRVDPTAGPASTTLGDRVAAAAPYVIGAACGIVGAVFGSAVAVIFALGMVQIPSRADIDTMRGRATWAGLVR